MIPQRIANLVFAAILLGLSGWMAIIAWDFETPALGDATLPTKFFPLVLLGFIVFCTLIYAREYLVHGQSGGDGDEVLYQNSAQAKTGLLTLASVVVSYGLWQQFGFAVAGLFATPAIAFAMGTRKISHYAIIAIGAGVTYFVFSYGLGTQFR
ncbi:MAG: tripartite tricarboxylate transporter TctB family protein [Candidatus Puniceispirillaceae bacterium]